MRLLSIIGTLDPSYGGPVEVCRQINIALRELGHQVEVVTLDGVDVPWIADFPGCVHALGPSTGKYRYNRKLISWLKEHSKDFDAILIDGIWQFQSFGTWVATRSRSLPYFVFVHGALDPWFKHAYPLKHMKKWLYWPWAEYRVLRDARAVFFTCDEERILARQSFWLYRANEAVVDIGILKPIGDPHVQREQFLRRFPLLRDKRLLLFLGRLHPIKGLDLLIESFADAAGRDPALHLIMAGPDQGWQKNLMALSKASGVEDRITWTGMLTKELKWGAFHSAEVFILPSHSENFGIVVAEALACGLPVLVTEKVNIWCEIVKDGAGFAGPDTLEGIITLFNRWLALTPEELCMMRERAISSYEHRFDIRQGAKKLITVIQKCLSSRTRQVNV